MLFQYVVAALCLIAAFMQLAAHRSPDVCDSKIRKSARRITVVSMVMGGVYFGASSVGWFSPILLLLVGLFASGQIMFAVSSLFKEQEA